MKDKEAILGISKFPQRKDEKWMNSSLITPNQALKAMEEYKNQFIQPQSPTLLCIEEKVIDGMIEELEEFNNMPTKDLPETLGILDQQEAGVIAEYLHDLKSKMKRISDVKSEAWDEEINNRINDFNNEIKNCIEYSDQYWKFKNIQNVLLDIKSKVSNGIISEKQQDSKNLIEAGLVSLKVLSTMLHKSKMQMGYEKSLELLKMFEDYKTKYINGE